MKKVIYFFAVTVIMVSASCRKKNDDNGANSNPCNLPTSTIPSDMVGEWVSGYTSFTEIRDAYDGRSLGTTWQSGKYMRLNANGKGMELYIMGGNMYAEYATKIEGTVTYNDEGILQFHACKAHYNAWSYGTKTVDRDATEAQLQNMTNNNRFYIDWDESGSTPWLQLYFVSDPQGSPTSFRKL
jgi:hypothetical protein